MPIFGDSLLIKSKLDLDTLCEFGGECLHVLCLNCLREEKINYMHAWCLSIRQHGQAHSQILRAERTAYDTTILRKAKTWGYIVGMYTCFMCNNFAAIMSCLKRHAQAADVLRYDRPLYTDQSHTCT